MFFCLLVFFCFVSRRRVAYGDVYVALFYFEVLGFRNDMRGWFGLSNTKQNEKEMPNQKKLDLFAFELNA